MHACCLARRVDEQDASKKCITALLVWSERHFRPSRWMIGRHTFHPSSPPSMVVGYQYSTRDLATTRTNSTEKGIAFLQRDLLFTDDEKKHFFESVFARMNVCVCVSVHMKKMHPARVHFSSRCWIGLSSSSALISSPRYRWTELNWTDQTKLRWLLSIRRDGLGYGNGHVGRRSGEGIGYSHSRSLVCLVDLFVCRCLLAASTYELHRRWMQFPIYGCILMQFFFIISEGIEVAPFSVNSLPAIRRVWTSTSWELCSHSAWRCDVSVCTCMQLYNGICNCKEPRGKKNASCIFAGDVIAHAVCNARFTCQGLLLLMLFLRSNNEWISCWLCLIRTRNSGIVKPITFQKIARKGFESCASILSVMKQQHFDW